MADKAFSIPPKFDIPKIRHLREGERIEFRELGIPNVFIGGTGVRVAEFPDGSVSVVIPPRAVLEMFEKFIFAELAAGDSARLGKAEVYYLRRMMKMTQQEFADALGLARETVCRIEKGKEKVATTVAMAIQRLCAPKVAEFLNQLPAGVRKMNRENCARIQSFLTPKPSEAFRVAKNFQIALAQAGSIALGQSPAESRAIGTPCFS